MALKPKRSASRKAPAKAAAKGGVAGKRANKSAAKKKVAAAPNPPPDAVRVWRGYKLAALAPPDFLKALGAIFIPITVQLQRLYGLAAYLPTVMPLEKAAGVPDEIALVFYESQQAYTDAGNLIVAGRTYSRLHSTVFDLTISKSGFPVPLPAQLAFDTPYHLFSEAIDWQQGFAQVFIGTRKTADSTTSFAAALFDFLSDVSEHRPQGLDGAIVCASANWVIYWEHWTSEGASLKGRISDLAEFSDLVLLQPFVSTPVETSLDAHYPGLNVTGSQSFNTQFTRAGKS